MIADWQKRILWPAAVGATLSFFVLPAYFLGGTWWTLAVIGVSLAFDLLGLWRLRPLLR